MLAVQRRLTVPLVLTSLAPLTATFPGEFNTRDLFTRVCAPIAASNCPEVSLMTYGGVTQGRSHPDLVVILSPPHLFRFLSVDQEYL